MENTVDLGVVQIHKKVIGDIAAAAIKEIPGVQLASFGFIGSIAEAFGYKNYPAVTVTIDKDTQVSLEIRVIIHYGMNIPQVARQIQDVIAAAVEEAVDIHLKEINVNIQAIERPSL
ncbi:MAG: Asp23/Gls24 family envelope stress response protein [Candidatus Omnitrophica bacterium]|nr:Asp23/Gls24 family envelope stress response protein [Candidatus Omnitrophota bacterium]MDE2222655.1 Asp23/Gls24 family envelope stress response protein [Candidatus Omnitrophota bacterium]